MTEKNFKPTVVRDDDAHEQAKAWVQDLGDELKRGDEPGRRDTQSGGIIGGLISELIALKAELIRQTRQPGNDEVERANNIVNSYRQFINQRPLLISLLYDVNMLPEQTTSFAGALRLAALCEVWKQGEEGKISQPEPETPMQGKAF